MFNIEIDLEKEDFDDIDFETNEDRDYILSNYKEFIDSEVENLYDLINQNQSPTDMINTINDNR